MSLPRGYAALQTSLRRCARLRLECVLYDVVCASCRSWSCRPWYGVSAVSGKGWWCEAGQRVVSHEPSVLSQAGRRESQTPSSTARCSQQSLPFRVRLRRSISVSGCLLDAMGAIAACNSVVVDDLQQHAYSTPAATASEADPFLPQRWRTADVSSTLWVLPLTQSHASRKAATRPLLDITNLTLFTRDREHWVV